MKGNVTVEAYGVYIPHMQSMQLSKYLSNKGISMNTLSKDERKNTVIDFIGSPCIYPVFVGAKETMEKIALRGARALNPKTMRFQLIDKLARYEVRKHHSGGLLYSLMSNIDLLKVANDNGLTV